MILYNCCSTDHNLEYVVTKFDDSFEVESSYTTSLSSCECPQFTGRGKECRHIKMLGLFINSEHIDDNYFLEYETGCFHRVGQDLAEDISAHIAIEPASEHGLGPKALGLGLGPTPIPPAIPSPTRRRVV